MSWVLCRNNSTLSVQPGVTDLLLSVCSIKVVTLPTGLLQGSEPLAFSSCNALAKTVRGRPLPRTIVVGFGWV